jgi:hypothetical protein
VAQAQVVFQIVASHKSFSSALSDSYLAAAMHVPYDILEQIVPLLKTDITNNDLLAALRASKALYVCAIPILYRSVILRGQPAVASFAQATKAHGHHVRRLWVDRKVFDHRAKRVDENGFILIAKHCPALEEFCLSGTFSRGRYLFPSAC